MAEYEQLWSKVWAPTETSTDESWTPRMAPGKVPTTARLRGGGGNMIFRVANAEAARDVVEGLAGDDRPGAQALSAAEPKVARASQSSGQALPDALRARFEQSLDTDLSGVRVHTGSDSAVASRAVKARAYTLGQDIHFAAGEYAPDTPQGQELLAHEVAHTVQQQGVSTLQTKLEVSSPGDALEREADVAARSMVAGSPFHGLSRSRCQVARVESFDEAAEDGEELAGKLIRDSPPPVLQVSNVGDRGSANTILSIIQKTAADMETGVSTGQIEPEKQIANTQAEVTLQDYITEAEKHSSHISTFQTSFGVLMRDYGRLQGMGAQFDGFNLDHLKDEKDGEKRGETQTRAIFGPDDPEQQRNLAMRADKSIDNDLKALEVMKSGLETKAEAVRTNQSGLSNTAAELSILDRQILGAIGGLKTMEARKAVLAAEKAAQSNIAAKIPGIVKDAVVGGLKGAAKGPSGAAKGAAEGAAKGVFESIVMPKVNKAIQDANISVGDFPDKSSDMDLLKQDRATYTNIVALLSQKANKSDAVKTASSAMQVAFAEYEGARDLYHIKMKETGRKMDEALKKSQQRMPTKDEYCKPGGPTPVQQPKDKGPRFELAFQFVSEADKFLAQAKSVIKEGDEELKVEEDARGKASTSSAAGRSYNKLKDLVLGGPVKIFLVGKKQIEKKSGSKFWRHYAYPSSFTIRTGNNPGQQLDGSPDEANRYGSAVGNQGFGANQEIKKNVESVKEAESKIRAYRDKLAQAIGM